VGRAAEFLLNALYTQPGLAMVAPVEFRILGPLEVVRDGSAVALGTLKQRALLALLLLHRNGIVPIDRLIEEVWPDDRPARARNNVEVYVSRLRRALGRDVLVTAAAGYLVRVGPGAADVDRFEGLVAAARAAPDPAGASGLLSDALGLWRGPALADFAYESFAQAEIARLDELRLLAVEQRIDADLAFRDAGELVVELERLVAEHPYRERFRAQLMLALYRCGRQSDALGQYRETARLLADELGIEPGPELKERERAILQHDPTLLRSSPAEPNLPSPPNRLIGRKRELRELAALLCEADTRLVTLLGTGGSGKTRLAVTVAAQLADETSTLAYFVDLAPLADADEVLPAIARAVGLEQEAATPVGDALRRFLLNHRLLLVLDNFEHLLGAAGAVAELIAAVPGVTVLATSRAPLRIRAEWRYEVSPLRKEDAVALFSERARAIRRGFEAGAIVEELCRRLDRLPLPIELAAARVDRQTPEQMLAGLDRRLEVLTDGPRDLPTRQRTLRATLDWSYGLLDDGACDAYARLAVFAGGCTPAAAGSVAGVTSELLDALADAALVRREDDRVLMLETVREYALERLHASGGEDDLRRAHARYYLSRVEAAGPDLQRPDTLTEISAEHENIRAALRWSRDGPDSELHLRLLTAVTPYWSVRGHLREADAWLQEAVQRSHAAPSPLRAAVLTAASTFAARLGDVHRAYQLAMDAHALYRNAADGRGAARALMSAAMALSRSDEAARRNALLEELEVLTMELADPALRAPVLRALGANVARAGENERGRALVEESLALARDCGSELDVGQALCHLGVIALQAGHPDEAREPLKESLAIAQRLGYREAAAYSLSGLASLAVAENELPRAARLLAAADSLLDELGTTRLPFIGDLDATTRRAVLQILGQEGFARLRAEAQAATLDELVAVGGIGATTAASASS
jgi:predicted ATPase/DNA-binding SARP family transcriptional activator